MKTNMKRWATLAAMTVIALAMQACRDIREEADEIMPARITASTESGSDTRTSLSAGDGGSSSVLWSEKDQIAVFIDGSSKADLFTLEEGAGTHKGVFRGGASGVTYYAFYPLSMLPSMSGTTIRLTLPSRQVYTPDSFAPGTFPMAAATTSDDLQFRNLCSVLRLSMTGYHSVTRIVFRTHDPSIKVCGKAYVTMIETGDPLLTTMESGIDSLVMTVSDVVLSEEKATDFYLVLPPQNYKGGFSVRVYTGNRHMDKDYPDDFNMVRSHIHKAAPFEFQPNGLDESTFLDGMGIDDDPFLIQSLPDLILMRDAVRNGRSITSSSGLSKKAASASYRLTCDLDLSIVCNPEEKKNWKPIGTEESQFTGNFDGGWHSIDNLYINTPASSYTGLFGYVLGSISNLSVSGSVCGYSYCGLIAGISSGTFTSCTADGDVRSANGYYTGGISSQASSVTNCINKAGVKGNGYTGGIAGFVSSVSDCINKGNVSGGSDTGGVAGYIANSIFNCFNYGKVTGSSRVGGIFGFMNYGVAANCMNLNDINGSDQVGGIAGYIHQGTRIVNCANHGGVYGSSEYAGGICGVAGYKYSRYNSSTVINCINSGAVVSPSAAGAICGLNAFSSDFYPSRVERNYWLWDSGKQLGMQSGIGEDHGESVSNFSLTDAEMKGAACGSELYNSYNVLTDALSAWAAENKYAYAQCVLQGWTYSGQGTYPVLSGFDAMQPGSGTSVLEVSPSSVEVHALGRDIEVEVLSSHDYTVSCPDWITAGDVRKYEVKPHASYHTFSVQANDSDVSREGSVTFTNTEGKVRKVKVIQKGRYLDIDVTGLVLYDTGGTKTVNVSSSIEWKVASSESWCLVTPAVGKFDGSFSVSASANESEKARGAVVTVSSLDNAFVKTLTVVQSGKQIGGQSDWMTHDFVHKSLGMRFTATWCGWCPRMNTSFMRAQEQYPDKITYIALHGGGSDLDFNQTSTLMSKYSISGFPTGLVDCRVHIYNYDIESTVTNIVNAVKETEDTYGTLTGVNVISTISGRNVTANVNVYAKKAGDYKLTVLLVEDGIINPQSDFEDEYHERYEHNSIVRIAMSGIDGDSFSMDSDLAVQSFSYSTEVPKDYNLANMRIVLYVQRKFGTYPVIRSTSDDYFVDNSASVSVGDVLKLALIGADGGGGGDDQREDNEGIVPGGDLEMD